MQVTRSRYIYKSRQVQVIQFTASFEDLSPKERDGRLQVYWPTLMELLAEKHVAISMHRQGLFHRKAAKNERIASEEIAKIEVVRNGILATLGSS